jgi:hypothetical protein
MKSLKPIFLLVLLAISTSVGLAQFDRIGLEGKNINELKIHENHLYAGTDAGLYVKDLSASTSSWNLVGLEDNKVTSFLIYSSDTLLVGTFEQEEQDSVYLFSTTDGGQSWNDTQNGFGSDTTSRSVVDLDRASPDIDTLYGINKNELYISSDKGSNWQKQEFLTYVVSNEKNARRKQESVNSPFQFVAADFQE